MRSATKVAFELLMECKLIKNEQVRERPSKIYSWIAFILANVIVEIPYQIMLGILVFGSYYYPIFGCVLPPFQHIITHYCPDRCQYPIFATPRSHPAVLHSDFPLCLYIRGFGDRCIA
jgi:hypothetical protein